MPLFRFKVSDAEGHVSAQLIEGDSQTDARRRLHRRGFRPLEFLGEGTDSAGGSGGKRRSKFDVVEFTDRLVPLLQADVPIERALGILAEGESNPTNAEVIRDLRRGLHEGRKLSQLIRDRGPMFPRLYASVVEAGEEAGALAEVMAELRRFLSDRREFQAFLVSASIYPLIVLLVSLIVMGVLLGFIVPKFAEVIINSGQTVPMSTQLLMNISDTVRRLWWLVPAAVVGFVVLLRALRREGLARRRFDALILKVPLLSRIVLLSDLSRLCRTLSILMRSGVHLLNTVTIGTRILQNSVLRESIGGLAGELRQGQRLSAAFSQSPLIPPFMLRMIGVGEETGAVETMLQRVAERYEQDLKQTLNRIVSLLEPILIVILGLIVAFIVVSMLFAIMDIQGGF
ncbi:MAG: type II secretion system F family protein [bacterium]